MPKKLRRAAGTAVKSLAFIVLVAALPACPCLKRYVEVYPVFEGRAVVRNAAGVELVVTTSGDPIMETFVLATTGDETGAPARAASKFKRALNRRLSAGVSEMFRARFGEGPWCLTAEPTILSTLEWTVNTPPDEDAPELPLCSGPPPPPACAELGEVPFLEVDPPSVSFGDVPLGTTSPWVALNITNGAAGYVCLASMVAGGRDPLDFEVDDADCRPTDPEMARMFIGPAGRPSCTVNVRFAPKRPGNREGALRVSSNAQPVLQEFRLDGRGLAGSLTLPPSPICVPRIADPTYSECYERELRMPNPGPGAVTLRGYGSDHEGSGSDWYLPGCWSHTLVPPGTDLVCRVRACSSVPPPQRTFQLLGDGTGVDPTATVVEFTVVAQQTPSTCTP
jgi:hypothetical protein